MQQNSWFVFTYAAVGNSTKDVQTDQYQKQLRFTQRLLMGVLLTHDRLTSLMQLQCLIHLPGVSM